MFSEKLKNKYNYNQYTTVDIDTVCNYPLFIFDLSYKIDADSLTEKIYDFREKNPASMSEYNKDNTNVRSWHSDYETHRMTNILDDLIDIKKEKINKIFTYRNGKVNTHNIWINVYDKDNFTERHNHNHFGVSTVYYPYVEDDSTPVIFDNNNLLDYKEYKIVPKKNMLIVFHSSLYHKVPKIKESRRISISANFMFERTSNRDPFIFQNTGK